MPRPKSSPRFLRAMTLALATCALFCLPAVARGQATTSSRADEAAAEQGARDVIKSVVQQTMAERSKAEQDAAQQAAMAERANQIGELIATEQFDEAGKGIRALEEIYSKDDPLVKRLKSYLEKEMEVANKKAPLQAVKDEIPDLLLSGNIAEAKTKVAEAKKAFPQDKKLSELGTIVTYVGLLKKILILVGLLAALSVIVVGVIYIWSKFVAACVYIFAVYLTSIPIGALLFLVIGPILAISGPPTATDGGAATTQEIQNMLTLFKQVGLATLSCCAGALGGAMAASFSLVTSTPKAKSNVRFSTYFFKPVNGFFIAFIMYVGVMSGQLAFSSSGGELGDQARWSICLLAILSGFFSDAAIEKLREIKQALFGKEVTVIVDLDEVSDEVGPKKARGGAGKADGVPVLDVELVEKAAGAKRNGGEAVV